MSVITYLVLEQSKPLIYLPASYLKDPSSYTIRSQFKFPRICAYFISINYIPIQKTTFAYELIFVLNPVILSHLTYQGDFKTLNFVQLIL